MEWNTNLKVQVGDKRIVTKFLLFPKSINGITRWLEVASWQERYKYVQYECKWIGIKWIDRNNIKELENTNEIIV